MEDVNLVSNTLLNLDQMAGNVSETVSGFDKLSVRENQDGKEVLASKAMVKITSEDIEDEINFWSSAMVCYVLGGNPPLAVMDGFCRRMWKDNVDKVGSPRHGVFIVRFHSVAFRDQIVNGGY